MTKTIIITGASDGIGAAAATQLASAGHRVVVVGRSPEKTKKVAEAIGAEHFLADFTELAQVRELATRLLDAYPQIDVLANNAGGIMGPRQLTGDGYEKTFQVNHLAPFLLTTLLIERLAASGASVVNTSSAMSKLGARLDLDNLNSERSYSAARAYGAGKLENVVFTKELHRRFHSQGISTLAFHPGVIASNFTSESSPFMKLFYRPPLSNLLESSDSAGRTLAFFAEGVAGTDWMSGEYYSKTKLAVPNKQALDATLCQALWDRSVTLVGSLGSDATPGSA
jgi:NAD(P)-dependent dehydrogenase (short-subunit alcohol dehydrogenase family)